MENEEYAYEKVVKRDRFRCVYCCRDMLHDFDSYWSVQMDHLCPRGGDDLENVVTACFVCNNLKGTFCPEGDSRKERIVSARKHVMQRRSEKMTIDYDTWLDREIEV